MSTHRENQLRLALELTGGLAVLVGLVLLAWELRQNTEAMQAATFQDLVHASSEFNVSIAMDPELRRIYLTGWRNPDRLSETDREAWVLLQASYWIRMQNVFFQYRRGTLAENDWQTYRAGMCGSAASPGGREYWPTSSNLTPSFLDFLKSCAKER